MNVIAVPLACPVTTCILLTEQSSATVWLPVAGVYVLATSVLPAPTTLPVIVPHARGNLVSVTSFTALLVGILVSSVPNVVTIPLLDVLTVLVPSPSIILSAVSVQEANTSPLPAPSAQSSTSKVVTVESSSVMVTVVVLATLLVVIEAIQLPSGPATVDFRLSVFILYKSSHCL